MIVDRYPGGAASRLRTLSYSLALAALGTGPALAVDVMPGDYTWPGAGRTFLVLYGQVSHAGSFTLDGTGQVPESKLDLNVGILRAVHYTELGGHRVAFQALQPFGTVKTARVGGAEQPVNNGIGDLMLAATWFPVTSDAPDGTTVGITTYLTGPTGAYDLGKVGLGTGTWTLTPQVGVIQGLGNGVYLDATLDVTFEADHTEGGVDLSRDPSVQVQTYLRYKPSATTDLALGYSGRFGGKLSRDGSYTGQKTRVDQIRAVGSLFVTPDTQLQLMLAKDVHVEGGFETDSLAQIRVLKVF